MTTTVRISLILAALLGVVVPGFGQGSTFYFTSTPESLIGQGETFTASAANGFTITAERNADNGVSLIISSENRYWFLDFAAPGDAPLAAGQYDNATVMPSQSSANARMLFSGEGHYVTTLTGNFEVLAIDYGPGNTINRFDANFSQFDDGILAQANMGEIRFNGLNPVPEPALMPLVAAGVFALFAVNWRRRRLG